jgi:hypothetical protein
MATVLLPVVFPANAKNPRAVLSLPDVVAKAELVPKKLFELPLFALPEDLPTHVLLLPSVHDRFAANPMPVLAVPVVNA